MGLVNRMIPSSVNAVENRATFERLLGTLRPKLHRYCTRMAGSVIDGEDLVQEALVKALLAFPCDGSIADPEAWLFRIAHNTALNFLQRRARGRELHSDEDPNMIVDPVNEAAGRLVAATSLRTLMHLSVSQRASVVLMDVLGYTLGEIGEITGSSIAAVKADLHRGRKRLRELSEEIEDLPLPVLEEPQRSRLALYIDRFNARDLMLSATCSLMM
jgi:RNA polymerase sigma-70 factor (ECF subfamily)